MDYIIRFVLCSGFFIAIYYAFFYSEKMFLFNRYYLLLSLLASLIIPVLTIESNPAIIDHVESVVLLNTQQGVNAIELPDTPKSSNIPWESILLGLYGIVSLTLLFRFMALNWILLNKTKRCNLELFHKAILVLTEVSSPPHSYFRYIFITKQDYENGLIDQKIIDHELAHVMQKHSLDILLIELLVVLTWFNPIIYFYRNAIRLNHEFLADEAVIQKSKNISSYKQLIVNHSAYVNGLSTNSSISSSFNYLNTKKRLTMLNANSIARIVLFKKISLVPLIVISVFLFSQKSIAQNLENIVVSQQNEISTLQDESEEELGETQEKKIDLKDFKVIVEKTENGIKMQSVQGSAWTDLMFSINNDQPQAINEYGMTELDKRSSKKDSNLTPFLFTITKTENGIVLKGIEGTAWTDLSFSLQENGKQAIDQFGMTKLN